jgi:hypothetical protein
VLCRRPQAGWGVRHHKGMRRLSQQPPRSCAGTCLLAAVPEPDSAAARVDTIRPASSLVRMCSRRCALRIREGRPQRGRPFLQEDWPCQHAPSSPLHPASGTPGRPARRPVRRIRPGAQPDAGAQDVLPALPAPGIMAAADSPGALGPEARPTALCGTVPPPAARTRLAASRMHSLRLPDAGFACAVS